MLNWFHVLLGCPLTFGPVCHVFYVRASQSCSEGQCAGHMLVNRPSVLQTCCCTAQVIPVDWLLCCSVTSECITITWARWWVENTAECFQHLWTRQTWMTNRHVRLPFSSAVALHWKSLFDQTVVQNIKLFWRMKEDSTQSYQVVFEPLQAARVDKRLMLLKTAGYWITGVKYRKTSGCGLLEYCVFV